MPKQTNKRGFTLIELIASIFIVALLSGAFMVNYHNANKRSELNMIKQKLASDLRLVQNNSLGAKTHNGASPKGGWGVHFAVSEPSSYIIFADLEDPNGNQAYEPGEEAEIKTLPAGVTISSLSAGGSPANSLDIVFFPPDPTTFVNASPTAGAQIILRENVNNSTAIVSVNSFGLIDTE